MPAAPARAQAPFTAQEAQTFQRAWAAHLAVPVEAKNSLGMRLVVIPPGEFLMGSSPEQVATAALWGDAVRQIPAGAERRRITQEEQPQHRVLLTQPLRMGATEVTIGQYRRFVEATAYVTETERFGGGNSAKPDETDPRKKNAVWRSPGYAVSDETPVSQLTYNDTLAFCAWLSDREQLPPAYRQGPAGEWEPVPGASGYRLPTEAEWEYACRAGTTTHYWFGDDPAALPDHAWYDRNADHLGARPVGTRRANAFGLFDMTGNVWERCSDWWAPDWYARSPVQDPTGPPTGARRIVRGAGWHYFALHCRSAYRNNYVPTARTGNTGFRVVRNLPLPAPVGSE